jgi:SAM-dependent methyltransferase
MAGDAWAVGDAYERYVGRWSRRVAEVFVRQLGVPAAQRWADVGCGTGALTETVLAVAEPARITGVDRSERFAAHARTHVADARAVFAAGDAIALPLPDGQCDVAVSGLALNFVPDAAGAAAELARVTAPDGLVAAYVWDYAGGMAMMRHFWDAAVALDPAAADLDEARRFPLCHPDALRELWSSAGLHHVVAAPIDVPTAFADFDDYWAPFLGGQGPAPGYVLSLPEHRRTALRERLRASIPSGPDGSIALTARAWTIRGTLSISQGS